MDFSWNDEQVALKKSISEFAQKELNDEVIERDRTGSFPREKWKMCAEFGILGLPIPQEYGGRELDVLSTILAMEGLGYGCRDNGLIFALNAQMWSVQMPILRFGSEWQTSAYLRKLVSGELIGAHGMTEVESGSDSFALTTTAEKQGDSYVLNGTKVFITNAPVADLFVIFATVNKSRGFLGITAFLVERGTPGVSVTGPTEKMGLKTASMGNITLRDCKVSAANRLGNEGNGGTIFKYSMGWERTCILASCIGTMERQIEVCRDHARTRRRFGKPIAAFQAVSHKIVDMKVRLDAARLLLYRAGWLRSQGREALPEVAMAKLYISQCFVQSSLDAVQLHGGSGYTAELELERCLRDSVGSTIYSGTSEIQKEIIARSLGL